VTLKSAAFSQHEFDEPMETPCIKVCVIDPKTRQCSGCKRTIDEIARWSSMPDKERRRIMADLAARSTSTAG
jgi:predicted Fe-S protein YdhL (DUF1289 family)